MKGFKMFQGRHQGPEIMDPTHGTYQLEGICMYIVCIYIYSWQLYIYRGYVCIWLYMYIYIYMWQYVYAYYIYIHVHVHIYIYIYMYIYTYTYIDRYYNGNMTMNSYWFTNLKNFSHSGMIPQIQPSFRWCRDVKGRFFIYPGRWTLRGTNGFEFIENSQKMVTLWFNHEKWWFNRI